MKKITTKISLSALGAILGIGRAFAADCPAGQICNPIGSATFEELMVKATYYLFLLSLPICSIMILYGAYLMLISRGDPGQIEKGKHTIEWAVWGLVAVILALGASSIIKELIGAAAE